MTDKCIALAIFLATTTENMAGLCLVVPKSLHSQLYTTMGFPSPHPDRSLLGMVNFFCETGQAMR